MDLQHAHRPKFQTQLLTRQGHARKLGCPAYHGHEQKKPPANGPIVGRGTNGREEHRHDLKQIIKTTPNNRRAIESNILQNSTRSRSRRWSSQPWFPSPRAGRIYSTHKHPDRMSLAHGQGHSPRQWRETERESRSSLWCVDINTFSVLPNMRRTSRANSLDNTHTHRILNSHPNN